VRRVERVTRRADAEGAGIQPTPRRSPYGDGSRADWRTVQGAGWLEREARRFDRR